MFTLVTKPNVGTKNGEVCILPPKEKIHIIDLEKNGKSLTRSSDYVQKLGAEGKQIVFLATKRQAKAKLLKPKLKDPVQCI